MKTPSLLSSGRKSLRQRQAWAILGALLAPVGVVAQAASGGGSVYDMLNVPFMIINAVLLLIILALAAVIAFLISQYFKQ